MLQRNLASSTAIVRTFFKSHFPIFTMRHHCNRNECNLDLREMAAQNRLEAFASAFSRLSRAKKMADEVRDNVALHRLAMETVFVLEDTAVLLWQMLNEHEQRVAARKLTPS